ncbi:hypothetical protein B0T24DRAFT_592705 [Lasiosphaeria ovina]|uniref:Uncharacterized protein n=1 Tax=Lasiosphaeria ovina TaxID=92902 RepID=A0AAE0KJN2_9PEZI|nr:hypothetical protein B0T24DRAFT_592705 [Lasiosphaeria ovina]
MRFSGYPSLRGPHHALGTLALLAACLLPLSSVAAASAQDKEKDKPKPKPISLDRTGGFQIGGKIISDPTNPNMTLSCDHGYMEYFIPSRRRARRASSCGTARARRCGRTGGTLGSLRQGRPAQPAVAAAAGEQVSQTTALGYATNTQLRLRHQHPIEATPPTPN